MSRDTTVIAFRQPDNINDPLTELAREGARRMLAQVLIAEADAFVAMWKDLKLPDGRDRIVRHGQGRIARSRPGLDLSRSVAPRCAIGEEGSENPLQLVDRRSCRAAETRACFEFQPEPMPRPFSPFGDVDLASKSYEIQLAIVGS